MFSHCGFYVPLDPALLDHAPCVSTWRKKVRKNERKKKERTKERKKEIKKKERKKERNKQTNKEGKKGRKKERKTEKKNERKKEESLVQKCQVRKHTVPDRTMRKHKVRKSHSAETRCGNVALQIYRQIDSRAANMGQSIVNRLIAE